MKQTEYKEPKTKYQEARINYNDNRNDGKISLRKIASDLYISSSTLSRIENGLLPATEKVIAYYSDKFGVPVEELVQTNPSEKIDIKALSSCGITQDVINTLLLLKKHSSYDYNLIDLVTKFLGSGEETVTFFIQMFAQLESEFSESISKNQDIIKSINVNYYARYIENVIKPSMKKQIARAVKIDQQINYDDVKQYEEEALKEPRVTVIDSQ